VSIPVALPEGYVLHRFGAIGSTNDEARRLAEAGAPAGQVVLAAEQTAGRGRAGRTWTSPPGNLYVSVLLRPGRDLATFGQLSLIASLALAEAVAGLTATPSAVSLKWPNDVLLKGDKIAGILLESGGDGGSGGRFVIIGSGVNLVSAPEDTPYPATSLAREGITGVTPERLLASYLEALERWRALWEQAGFAEIRAAWLARAANLHGPIRLRLPGEETAGRFADLTPGGALILELQDGSRREIAAGDVVLGAGP
jgi:BirA family biotin operon repressor/biotin-[acetyl-CoA-carboxylase] ligase